MLLPNVGLDDAVPFEAVAPSVPADQKDLGACFAPAETGTEKPVGGRESERHERIAKGQKVLQELQPADPEGPFVRLVDRVGGTFLTTFFPLRLATLVELARRSVRDNL